MAVLTDDPSDPRLTRDVDSDPVPQADVYLVLSDKELAAGYVRPVRSTYRHETCGAITTMSATIAATYARKPDFYGATYCVSCRKHCPVGAAGEFTWIERDGTTGPKVGT